MHFCQLLTAQAGYAEIAFNAKADSSGKIQHPGSAGNFTDTPFFAELKSISSR